MIEVPIDCNQLYGPRDESLVLSFPLREVPEEYHEVGMSILMESDTGKTKTFIVTQLDRRTITIDGNNPLSGREVIFRLEVLLVRDASEEEMEYGGKVEKGPDVKGATKVRID